MLQGASDAIKHAVSNSYTVTGKINTGQVSQWSGDEEEESDAKDEEERQKPSPIFSMFV